MTFLISCDYATCAVPEAYREVFRGAEDTVTSTRGWEPGALNLAQAFAIKFRTQLVHGDITRLLIDLGQDGDARWSEFAMTLPETTRPKLVARHEQPYREMLAQRIAEDLLRHPAVLHLMVHTEAETTGKITLATPANAALAEKISHAWRDALTLKNINPVLANTIPPSAIATFLAEKFPATHYAQIRLSVSQSFFLEGRPLRWEVLKKSLIDSLAESRE